MQEQLTKSDGFNYFLPNVLVTWQQYLTWRGFFFKVVVIW